MQFSRICKCSFAVKYGTGKSGSKSTESLIEESNRDGNCGELLAAMCEQLGGAIGPVCNPCAQKIRNLLRLFNGDSGDSEVLTFLVIGSSPLSCRSACESLLVSYKTLCDCYTPSILIGEEKRLTGEKK